ncbi:MAG: SUMF1/EgtB/PvdO family nonheme iron enzyme [Phycisphaerales bacterium]|nr:SUMF1/EgtB/PvdO family nonheme iron enzyme [Phycisphaerales bacterium]
MKYSSTFFYLLFISFVISSCSGGFYGLPDDGQLHGVPSTTKNFLRHPYGMVYIPSGFFHLGNNDQDVAFSINTKNRSVSMAGFWMDATVITNDEYRQFVEWVADSTYAMALGVYRVSKEGDTTIDWTKYRNTRFKYNDPAIIEKLAPWAYEPEERLNPNVLELNPTKLIFTTKYFDLKAAAAVRPAYSVNRAKFIVKVSEKVYPDTLCWMRDYTYSYNEPIAKRYFSHPSYGNYPVVGVTWKQASAFCYWRSNYLEKYLRKINYANETEYRLPTETEWEYAARGGRDQSMYPWGGPYLRNKKGCLLANFKPGLGNYAEDGGLYTVRADAYWPNDYGLYNMAGNVSQWTSTYFHEAAYSFYHDLNPDLQYSSSENDLPRMKRKVVRGGSWKDIGYYLQCGTRTFEYQDSARCYIGFRCVIDLVAPTNP